MRVFYLTEWDVVEYILITKMVIGLLLDLFMILLEWLIVMSN